MQSSPSSSSSWYHAASTDLTDPLSPSISIVHCSRRSSRLYPVSAQSCCIYILAGRPCLCSSMWRGPQEYITYEFVFTSPAVSRKSGSSRVFVIGGRWPYSCCSVGCCLQGLFNTARRILVQLPSSFFSLRLVSVYVVHPYISIETTAAWKNCVLFYWSGLTSIWPIAYR